MISGYIILTVSFLGACTTIYALVGSFCHSLCQGSNCRDET